MSEVNTLNAQPFELFLYIMVGVDLVAYRCSKFEWEIDLNLAASTL
jgi:hypothetical protein